MKNVGSIAQLTAQTVGLSSSSFNPVIGRSFVTAASAAWKRAAPGLDAGASVQDEERYESDMPTTTYALQALEHMSLKPGVVKSIMYPDKELSVQIPVTMRTGDVQLFSGHLAMHNNSRGPFKGGLIFHPDVTLEALRSLAALNTWKTALMDIPFGGAKAGVAFDPRFLNQREQEKLTRSLVKILSNNLGHTQYVPAPDIGSNETHMAWMFDQYSRMHGFSPAAFTGKPLCLHGSHGRETAAGRGVSIAGREFLNKFMKQRVAGTTFLMQGFGKTGTWTAQYLEEQGGKIVGVSSCDTAVYNENGLDIKALRHHVVRGGYLAQFGGGAVVPNDSSFLEIPADVVVPAAVAGTINAETASKLQCRMVLEAANSGITPEGNAILAHRGIPVCPDVFASGGAVVVSFFEWVQNIQNLRWEEDEVLRMMERYVEAAFQSMSRYVHGTTINHRTAAYIVALERIAIAELNRGHN